MLLSNKSNPAHTIKKSLQSLGWTNIVYSLWAGLLPDSEITPKFEGIYNQHKSTVFRLDKHSLQSLGWTTTGKEKLTVEV